MSYLTEKAFDLLQIDTARFDPETTLQLQQRIVNALTELYKKRSDLKTEMISTFGSTPKKSIEGYDAKNAEKYQIEDQIEALKGKCDYVSQVLYWKGSELRHLLKTQI